MLGIKLATSLVINCMHLVAEKRQLVQLSPLYNKKTDFLIYQMSGSYLSWFNQL
jgi:hypothetical protein